MVTLKGDKHLSESKGALFLLLEASFSFQIMEGGTDLNCQSVDWFLFNGNIGLKWVKPVTITYPFPANNYLFKVNNKNDRKRCEICSKLTMKTPERRHLYPIKTSEKQRFPDVFIGYRRRRSGVFIVNFEYNISHLFLVFLSLILKK